MKTFNDAAGRTWTISLNLGTAIAVKDALGIDLLQPEQGDPPLLTRLGTDELLLSGPETSREDSSNGGVWRDRRKPWVPAQSCQVGRFVGPIPRLEPVTETPWHR
jgi:hypothetical protein